MPHAERGRGMAGIVFGVRGQPISRHCYIDDRSALHCQQMLKIQKMFK